MTSKAILDHLAVGMLFWTSCGCVYVYLEEAIIQFSHSGYFMCPFNILLIVVLTLASQMFDFVGLNKRAPWFY